MRIIFLGTPEFSVPTLSALCKSNHEIIAVVTQPDKSKNRGYELLPPPVKVVAKENGLNVLQYRKIREDGINDLVHLKPDIMITCAYGQILSQEIIDIPKYGIVNLHASLLPKYRGSSPINWAIINGETTTGITLMKTEIGIDTGDMLGTVQCEIGENETAGELFEKISTLGGDLLLEFLDKIETGDVIATPQNHELATHCKMFKKSDGAIDFTKSAKDVHNHIRGMNPWPCGFFTYNDKIIKVFESRISEVESEGEAGEVVVSDTKNGLVIKCGEGAVEILSLQFPNAKRTDAKSFLNGRSIEIGTKF